MTTLPSRLMMRRWLPTGMQRDDDLLRLLEPAVQSPDATVRRSWISLIDHGLPLPYLRAAIDHVYAWPIVDYILNPISVHPPVYATLIHRAVIESNATQGF